MPNADISPQFRQRPADAIEAYRANGYHIECDIWSAVECANLVEAAQAFPGRREDDFRILNQMHKTDDLFLAAMRKPEVVEIAEGLFGAEASGIQSGFFFASSGTTGFPWHQDNIYVETDPTDFVLAWTALCDTTPRNGCLAVFPGSHREPILPVRNVAFADGPERDEGAYDGETIVPERYSARDVVIPKGSTVFLHGHMVHGSRANRSDDFRYAMFNSYIRKGASFRAGGHAKRTEIALHDDDHVAA